MTFADGLGGEEEMAGGESGALSTMGSTVGGHCNYEGGGDGKGGRGGRGL